MKKIFYTNHLKLRLQLREIPHNLPREIYRSSKERYFDNATQRYVAVKMMTFRKKVREMAVTYEEDGARITLITIHPLRAYQKIARIRSGRWKKL